MNKVQVFKNQGSQEKDCSMKRDLMAGPLQINNIIYAKFGFKATTIFVKGSLRFLENCHYFTNVMYHVLLGVFADRNLPPSPIFHCMENT